MFSRAEQIYLSNSLNFSMPTFSVVYLPPQVQVCVHGARITIWDAHILSHVECGTLYRLNYLQIIFHRLWVFSGHQLIFNSLHFFLVRIVEHSPGACCGFVCFGDSGEVKRHEVRDEGQHILSVSLIIFNRVPMQ